MSLIALCHIAAKFGVFVDEDHGKLPTLYWLSKLHQRPYNSCFIANYSSCTITVLSLLLISCLTAFLKKKHFVKYSQTVYERNRKSTKDSKDQESIHSSTTPVPGHQK